MSQNLLPNEIYNTKKHRPILIIIAIVFFVFVFIINFPFKKFINTKIATLIHSNSPCPIQYNDFDFLLFMPGIELKDVMISQRCSPLLKSDIPLSFIDIRLKGFDFAVLGPKVSIETNLKRSSFYQVVSSGGNEIFIGDMDIRLNLSELARLIETPIKLSGNIDIEGELDIENKKVRTMAMNLYSKNLKINETLYNGFPIPQIDIGKFQFIFSKSTGTKLSIDSLVMGDGNKDIHGKVKGIINVTDRNFMASPIDLNGRVKFSNKFLRTFSVINLFLGNFKNEETGYYEFDLKGTLSSPKPSRLKK